MGDQIGGSDDERGRGRSINHPVEGHAETAEGSLDTGAAIEFVAVRMEHVPHRIQGKHQHQADETGSQPAGRGSCQLKNTHG